MQTDDSRRSALDAWLDKVDTLLAELGFDLDDGVVRPIEVLPSGGERLGAPQ